MPRSITTTTTTILRHPPAPVAAQGLPRLPAMLDIGDGRDNSELVQRRAALRTQQEQLHKLVRQPRPEEVPQEEANVKAAEAALGDARHQLTLAESLQDKRAMSAEARERIAEAQRKRWAAQKKAAN